MQWLMLQQETPEDFVIATGEQHSVREFIERAGKVLGLAIKWEGAGTDEKGINLANGKTIISVDPTSFRPTEVETLLGDPTKAKEKLGWEPEITFETLVRVMARADLEEAKRDELLNRTGFQVNKRNE